MGKLITVLWILICSLAVDAQDSTFNISLQKTIIGEYTDFSIDEMGNMYLILNRSKLKKLDSNGDSVAVFSDIKRYGKIHSVDATNPLKILLYYKNTSTIIVLDRLLSVRSVIDLRKNNIQQVKAVRLSYDNNIWLYEEVENKIKKIDENGKLLLQTADLRNVFSTAPSFESLFDDNRSLYLYDSDQGWFIFDYYGAFIKKYSFTNWKDVQVLNSTMIGRSENNVLTAKQGAFYFTRQKFPVSLSKAVKVQHNTKQTYILFKDRLEIYDAP